MLNKMAEFWGYFRVLGRNWDWWVNFNVLSHFLSCLIRWRDKLPSRSFLFQLHRCQNKPVWWIIVSNVPCLQFQKRPYSSIHKRFVATYGHFSLIFFANLVQNTPFVNLYFHYLPSGGYTYQKKWCHAHFGSCRQCYAHFCSCCIHIPSAKVFVTNCGKTRREKTTYVHHLFS